MKSLDSQNHILSPQNEIFIPTKLNLYNRKMRFLDPQTTAVVPKNDVLKLKKNEVFSRPIKWNLLSPKKLQPKRPENDIFRGTR